MDNRRCSSVELAVDAAVAVVAIAAVTVLGIMRVMDSQAIAALISAVVGYVFGQARRSIDSYIDRGSRGG